MKQNDLALIYAWDAYCGWCYGFSKTLQIFHENHPELPLTVWSGGLFVGRNKRPIGSFPHVPEANKRISQLTGAEFGTSYQSLLEEGHFVMDSEIAAKGFSALRTFAPERAYDLASSMQHAFYYEGKSLSDPATYRDIAMAHNLDPDGVQGQFESAVSTKDAHADIAMLQQLGVQSFPTLLLQKGGEYFGFGGDIMTVEKLETRLVRMIQEIEKQETIEASTGMSCDLASGSC
ncbi:DsbA family protein [Paenibacillus glycanilyticus]|uniref:DsbA family protein n=1 Tax=Paenibacillus glycanilyticus TaxID=126569 RepID=UPI00203E9AE9|nr:DsbA family protein [Paenibacillus glycanilyticus]MCM3629876.1 DsbA family protein [Paenibacillus glycanilyticus]